MPNEFSRSVKKNFVLVPVVASVLVGTFTGVILLILQTQSIQINKKL